MYTKNELIEQMTEQIKDIINLELKFTKNIEEIEEIVNDEIFQMINNSEYVIYTDQAKKISETIDLYDVFEISDITGERFRSWSEVAFENLYYFIHKEIDVNELIKTTLVIDKLQKQLTK